MVGTAGNNILAGGAGNDLVFAGAGNDAVLWRTGDGRDFIDGGTGTDTFRIMNGTGPVQQLTLAQARAQFANLAFRDDTQTVVVRNGIVIGELKNVEQVVVNSVATGAPVVTDATPTNGLVSPTEGQPLGALLTAIQDGDGLGTFTLRWPPSAAKAAASPRSRARSAPIWQAQPILPASPKAPPVKAQSSRMSHPPIAGTIASGRFVPARRAPASARNCVTA